MCMADLPTYISVHQVCAVSTETRRGCWILWNQNYRWLWATVWALGTQPLQEQLVLLTADDPSLRGPGNHMYLFVCLHLLIEEGCVSAPVGVWESEVSWWESFLSFLHVDPRDQTQVTGLVCKHCTPLSHTSTLLNVILKN